MNGALTEGLTGLLGELPALQATLALVDHSTPGVNDEIPEGTPIEFIIDHHPTETIDARFADHRESIGATATILTEYVSALDMEIDTTLATALMFAIRRETLGFLRGTTRAEYAAAGKLHVCCGCCRIHRSAVRQSMQSVTQSPTVSCVGTS